MYCVNYRYLAITGSVPAIAQDSTSGKLSLRLELFDVRIGCCILDSDSTVRKSYSGSNRLSMLRCRCLLLVVNWLLVHDIETLSSLNPGVFTVAEGCNSFMWRINERLTKGRWQLRKIRDEKTSYITCLSTKLKLFHRRQRIRLAPKWLKSCLETRYNPRHKSLKITLRGYNFHFAWLSRAKCGMLYSVFPIQGHVNSSFLEPFLSLFLQYPRQLLQRTLIFVLFHARFAVF